MQVLIPVPEKGEDKVRVNLFLSIGRGFFLLVFDQEYK